MSVPNSSTVELELSTDPRIRLCNEMMKIRAFAREFDGMVANKQWGQLTAAMSNMEWALMYARYAVRDIYLKEHAKPVSGE